MADLEQLGRAARQPLQHGLVDGQDTGGAGDAHPAARSVLGAGLERRQRLVEIAAERDLLILEDNPYSMLRYEGDPIPTLHSLDDAGNVMYLGTFSKVFAPGVRLGWVTADSAILARINLVKQAADLCSSSLTQHVVSRFFDEHDWQRYIQRLVNVYRERRDAMVSALERWFPERATWTVPEGGQIGRASCRERV